jgi:hypothetical protein
MSDGGALLGDMHETPPSIRPGALVEIDGHRVLRKIGVIDAIAGDALPARPLAEVARILAQPVAEDLRTGRACWRRLSYLGARLRCCDGETIETRLDRAVEERMGRVAAQACGTSERLIAREDSGLPASKAASRRFPSVAYRELNLRPRRGAPRTAGSR